MLTLNSKGTFRWSPLMVSPRILWTPPMFPRPNRFLILLPWTPLVMLSSPVRLAMTPFAIGRPSRLTPLRSATPFTSLATNPLTLRGPFRDAPLPGAVAMARVEKVKVVNNAHPPTRHNPDHFSWFFEGGGEQRHRNLIQVQSSYYAVHQS